ncbi:MAG: Hpt domain-containing protein [bacterium]|nr:Hpt domain-containing protein [bacterium]
MGAFEREAYLESFREEASRLVGSLAAGAAVLAPASPMADTLRRMAREAHTLRGSAVMMGLERIARDARLLEEDLEAAVERGGRPGGEEIASIRGRLEAVRAAVAGDAGAR